MSLLDYLIRRKRKPTANVAKERLQIILSHENSRRNEPDYLPALKRELLNVVARYVKINENDIKMSLERDGECEILELNISLPEEETVT